MLRTVRDSKDSVMRSLHTAALAILVWYLLFPPQTETSQTIIMKPDTSAPLSQWQPMSGEKEEQSGAFKTKAECEDYRSKMILDAKDKLRDAPRGVENMPSETHTVKWTFALGALKSQCVVADDPRLKAK
jgi:hypothetical protein